MFDRRMVRHEIDDDMHAVRSRVIHELDIVAERAVLGVHTVVIRDIVPVVAIRRGVERLQPDAGNTQSRKVIQTPAQAFEVADTVAIRVHVLFDVEAVNDGVLVPEVLYRHGYLCCSQAFRRRRKNRRPLRTESTP